MRSGLWIDHVSQDFLRRVRAAANMHVAPYANDIDKRDVYPLDSIKALAAEGLTSLSLPIEHGGEGANYAEVAALFEEMSYYSAAVGISLITIFQAQSILRDCAAESLKSRVLKKFREGLITSYALTEANHGSDIRSLDTKAEFRDGRWILSGRKSFITSGTAAEAFIVLAETPTGVSAFFLWRDIPGVRMEMGSNAATFGLRNGPHVDLILDSVELPEDHLIGVEGKGVRHAVSTLNYSRTMAAAISTGIARAAFDGALDFAAKRVAFDTTVASFQGIQWYFADTLTEIDAARLLVFHAARALDQDEDVSRHASEAKLMASRVATECASRAVQICGAYGVTEGAPFGRYLRDAKAYEIAGGSSEIMKNTIAKHLVKVAAGRPERQSR